MKRKVLKLEKSLSKLTKYHDYDDIECKIIRYVKYLFNLSIDEDYYKPIKTNDAFNSNYIEYECEGGKSKTLSIKEYINLIRPYLRDAVNDHKSQGKWKFHSGNEVFHFRTQEDWKNQSTLIINFISSKDSDEIRTVHTNSSNIEIMMSNETDKIFE